MSYIKAYEEWLKNVKVEELQELKSVEGDEDQLKRRFLMPLEFGTAGMRGIIALGTGCINNYTVARASKGLANYIRSLGESACNKGVVISFDTRNWSYEFALRTAGVLADSGIKVYLFNDVRPVPMCSFAIRHLGAIAGVMITASHNSKEYNGYKVYGDDGAQMSPEATGKVVDYINEISDYFNVNYTEIKCSQIEMKDIDGEEIVKNVNIIGKSVDEEYYSIIQKLCLSNESVKRVSKKIKIVYTPLHGAGYLPVTQMLSRLNIPYNIVEEQREADGNFPTVSMPNPEQPEALYMGIKLAKTLKSDIVIGTDPDCDRMGVAIRKADGEFLLLSGNQIGAMLLDYILKRNKENGTLPENAAVIKTIVTTNLADKIAKDYNVEVFNVLTGFKFIGELIKEWEGNHKYTFMFGYEESFGYLSGTHSRDKDAVVASMLFAEMACFYEDKGLKLIEVLENLFKKHGYFAEVSKSIAFSGVDGMEQMRKVMDKLRSKPIKNIAGINVLLTQDFGSGLQRSDKGSVTEIALPRTNALKLVFNEDEWVCVRPSGTEPKLKVYVSVKSDSKELAMQKNNDVLGFLISLI